MSEEHKKAFEKHFNKTTLEIIEEYTGVKLKRDKDGREVRQ